MRIVLSLRHENLEKAWSSVTVEILEHALKRSNMGFTRIKRW